MHTYRQCVLYNAVVYRIPEKSQAGWWLVEDMEFPRILKKNMVKLQDSIKKDMEFPRVFKKKSCGVSMVFGF